MFLFSVYKRFLFLSLYYFFNIFYFNLNVFYVYGFYRAMLAQSAVMRQ